MFTDIPNETLLLLHSLYDVNRAITDAAAAQLWAEPLNVPEHRVLAWLHFVRKLTLIASRAPTPAAPRRSLSYHSESSTTSGSLNPKNNIKEEHPMEHDDSQDDSDESYDDPSPADKEHTHRNPSQLITPRASTPRAPAPDPWRLMESQLESKSFALRPVVSDDSPDELIPNRRPYPITVPIASPVSSPDSATYQATLSPSPPFTASSAAPWSSVPTWGTNTRADCHMDSSLNRTQDVKSATTSQHWLPCDTPSTKNRKFQGHEGECFGSTGYATSLVQTARKVGGSSSCTSLLDQLRFLHREKNSPHSPSNSGAGGWEAINAKNKIFQSRMQRNREQRLGA